MMKAMRLLLLPLLLVSIAKAQGETPAACEIGTEVPSFFVREVTTERPNLATCLVCRYGNRPVVLICVRDLDAQGEKLLAGIDQAIDGLRGVGVKGFAVFLTERPAEVQPRLMSLARQGGIRLPLTIPVESDGPQAVRPPANASLAVICYQQRKIVAAHVLASDEITAVRIDRVLTDVQKLADQSR